MTAPTGPPVRKPPIPPRTPPINDTLPPPVGVDGATGTDKGIKLLRTVGRLSRVGARNAISLALSEAPGNAAPDADDFRLCPLLGGFEFRDRPSQALELGTEVRAGLLKESQTSSVREGCSEGAEHGNCRV